MEKITFKPLGTVVKLEGSERKMMIVARGIRLKPTEDGDTVLFDYGAVLYPQGLIANRLIYFQDSDITEVLGVGYSNEADKEYVEELNKELSSSGIGRGDIKQIREEMKASMEKMKE